MHDDAGQPAQGASRQPDGSVVWRVWAPKAEAVSLVIVTARDRLESPMTPEGEGYFIHRQTEAAEGLRYAFRLGDGRDYPDPASRWQPDGVHSPSALFFPGLYPWSDAAWRGVAREELVLYELHVGTFTPEGTFAAIIPRLAELRRLGVTAIELMPVAQFPGDRGWGYDGVYPFAVQESYGGPRALQQLVDAAHQAGLAVFLDVVYNHLGPEGNYCEQFGPYFTDRYRTPWGKAVNYDGPDCDPVRQFVIDNACYWVRDFHLDGLRLDAVHAIYDFSPRHILADIKAAVGREAARQGRTILVIAESDQNDVRLVRPAARGGYGLDAVWADDFHHALHALLTGQRDGYYLDFGRPEQLAKALREPFVYDGCYSPFRRRRHGTRPGKTDRSRFVVCVQNHDQVGNRARGERFGSLVSPAAERLACGLLLLSPYVPLLFMGEEYGQRRPFPFFCSFGDPQIVEAVRRGRREEFAALSFRWAEFVVPASAGGGGGEDCSGQPAKAGTTNVEMPDPQDPATFAAAKLDWAWCDGSPQQEQRRLYADLLAARREWPALKDRRQTTARLLGGDPPLLLLRRGGKDGVLAVANLSPDAAEVPPGEIGGKELLLSTEDARYGGVRGAEHPREEILPYELLIFGTRDVGTMAGG